MSASQTCLYYYRPKGVGVCVCARAHVCHSHMSQKTASDCGYLSQPSAGLSLLVSYLWEGTDNRIVRRTGRNKGQAQLHMFTQTCAKSLDPTQSGLFYQEDMQMYFYFIYLIKKFNCDQDLACKWAPS